LPLASFYRKGFLLEVALCLPPEQGEEQSGQNLKVAAKLNVQFRARGGLTFKNGRRSVGSQGQKRGRWVMNPSPSLWVISRDQPR